MDIERVFEDASKRHLTLFRKIADAVAAGHPIDARTQREMERLPELAHLEDYFTQAEMQRALYRVAKEMIAQRQET